jgi:PPP family 3-phenylpropionic acid transporter
MLFVLVYEKVRFMKKTPFPFFVLYFLVYMLNVIYSTFFPVYLDGLDIPSEQIGILLSIGPFINIFAQPFWGIASDRAKYKNTAVMVMFVFSALTVLLFPLSRSFYYLIICFVVFMFFRTSAPVITDAIALEYLNERNLSFGPVRIAGSIGYSAMAILAGILSKGNGSNIFYLYAVASGLAFLVMFFIPKIEGHRKKDQKQPVTVLFQYKSLMKMILFAFVIQVTMGYYYSFAYIHMRNLGADNTLIGVATMIASLSGIPFLWFAKKIIDKLGPEMTLLAAGFVTGLRWLFFAFVQNPWVLAVLQVLHGLTFIVFSYTLSVNISKKVPADLKATGQSLNALVVFGISSIVGSALGGILDAELGSRGVFLINLALAMIACLLYFRECRKEAISSENL